MKTDNKTVTLTQKNVEDLVFFDSELQKRLPEFSDLFQTWQLGKRIPVLRPTAQKAILDFIDRLNDDSIAALEDYFGCKVVLEKLDHCIVRSYTMNISEAEEALNGDIEKYDRFFIHRKGEQVYISFWR